MKQFFAGLFQLSDEQAMWRVQMHDDPDAFGQLLSRWQDPIRRLCARMLGDQHKAEDMAQEAFARIYAKRKEFQHGSKFSTFLWRVAVNLCIDEIRRIKRRREFSLLQDGEGDTERTWEDIPTDEKNPRAAADASETAALVKQAVLHLPEHYKSVVVLRHYENLKFREIAEVLGIPEGTVKSRMAEALTILSVNLARKPPAASSGWSNPRNKGRQENFVL